MPTRNTVQRQIIAEGLRRLANHPTADEVYEAVREEHPGIGQDDSVLASAKLRLLYVLPQTL